MSTTRTNARNLNTYKTSITINRRLFISDLPRPWVITAEYYRRFASHEAAVRAYLGNEDYINDPYTQVGFEHVGMVNGDLTTLFAPADPDATVEVLRREVTPR